MQPVIPCATSARGAAARNSFMAPALVRLDVTERDPAQAREGTMHATASDTSRGTSCDDR